MRVLLYRILSLACLLFAPSVVRAGNDFLTEGNVLILVGIAGDAETEKQYEDQVVRLLAELKPAASNLQHIFLLTDLQISTDLPVQRFEASREKFLGLTAQIQGQPLTLFAWGHGGLQGTTPVFHIRGPRLNPADFRTIADAASKSDWTLMFTGSGEFAKALAGENQRILASEHETRFESDPIGMSLLIKELTKSRELAILARGFGKELAALYEARHLVRTEEPTLWLGAEDPKKLATPEDSQTSEGSADSSQDNRDANWTKLSRVKPSDFPEDDGVVLRRRISFVLGESTAIQEEREEVIQILTPEGKKLGDFDIQFSPPEETLEFVACEVLKPDGKMETVDPDAIREVKQKEWAEYGTPSRKVFSMPGVVPGALLHVHFRRSWKHFPLPNVSLEIPVAGEAPALGTSVEVRLSSKAAFHFMLRGLEGIDPKIETRGYSQIYRWEFPQIPASRPEPLSATNADPALMISTFPDWDSFSSWYRRLIKLADESSPELEQKAKELTANAKTDLDKARALYEFVASLRYVAVPLGVNSMRPHAAANVLRNQFGDCKDKANLYNTMLRIVGINADLVLVPRFAQAFPATPGLAFNHAISRVKLDGKIVWVDTTDDVCRFGLLPPGDSGRNVLVIHPDIRELTSLPQGQPGDHRLTILQEIDLTAPNPAVKIQASASGYFDYAFRAATREVTASRPAFPILGEMLRSRVADLRMIHQEFTGVAELNKPFEWQATASYPQLLQPLPDGKEQILHAPFHQPNEWSLAIQRRSHPLFLNQGYPGKIEERILFQLPTGMAEVELPQSEKGSDGLFSWSISWSQTQGKVEARSQVEWLRGELSVSETVTFQREMERLQAAAALPAVMQKGR